MAAAKKTSAKTKQTKDELKVITSTAEEKVKTVSKGNKMVYIACGLQLGVKFDDVDDGHGGFKTITFPGINSSLRGVKKLGILLGSGNAVLTSIGEDDWECIKRKHGKERMFTCMPPLLMEVKSQAEFHDREDEIAEMKTGLEPVNPADVGVEEQTED